MILVAFGDMLRVPANVPKREPRSLEQARAAGGDVRPIASPARGGQDRRANPDREVVFFAAGFETTTAPVAGLVAEGLPPNLSILLSGRLTWPAVAMLLDSEEAGFDALIAPGHVATIMGPEEWGFVPEEHGIPSAVSGFETDSLLAALHSVLRQHLEGRAFLDNCYARVAKPGGNPTARRLMDETLDVVDANWRGIGIIPRSGFALKPELGDLDAVKRFGSRPTCPASAPAKCRRAAIARAWCSARSIPTSASSMARPARRAIRSARAWCRTRAPAASGGRRACEQAAVDEHAPAGY